MKIIIKEDAKNRLFNESILMDKERGKNARAFRKALNDAIKTHSYELDSETNTIYIDGFSYTYGKKYAEDANGEPIPLHYTFDTVSRILQPLFKENSFNGYDNGEYDSEYDY